MGEFPWKLPWISTVKLHHILSKCCQSIYETFAITEFPDLTNYTVHYKRHFKGAKRIDRYVTQFYVCLLNLFILNMFIAFLFNSKQSANHLSTLLTPRDILFRHMVQYIYHLFNCGHSVQFLVLPLMRWFFSGRRSISSRGKQGSL